MNIEIQELYSLSEETTATIAIIRQVLLKAAEVYALPEENEVSVVLCDDNYIRILNNEYRGKNYSTDVLSFALNDDTDELLADDNNENFLGDIVISLETAKRQALEYGHSTEREIAYLTLHGMLHLLGYDHEDEDEKREMRQEEEHVLRLLNLSRDDKDNFMLELLETAREARESAYAHYSKFAVGAALRTDTGRIYHGCNIENASFGLTICAERTAVFNAVANGERSFVALAVVADTAEPVVPCGACLQVLAEFGVGVVIMGNMQGGYRMLSLTELLPLAFTGEKITGGKCNE